MTEKIILDSNILIHAFFYNPEIKGQEDLNQKAKNLINSNNTIFTTHNSILEFYRVLTSKPIQKYINKDFVLESMEYIKGNCQILYPDSQTDLILNDLIYKHEVYSGKIWDILLLAQSIQNNINKLYTKNLKDFPTTDFVEIVDII